MSHDKEDYMALEEQLAEALADLDRVKAACRPVIDAITECCGDEHDDVVLPLIAALDGPDE